MKSQDILILLKLISLQQQALEADQLKEQSSARALESSLGISKSEANASINRSIEAGLAHRDRKLDYPKANVSALLEFLSSGIKYVFPVKPAELVRGIPTAFDAPQLQSKLKSHSDYPYVWPAANGQLMGQAIKPLFKSVPDAVAQDERLYEYLALIDALRIGNAREANLAQQLLEKLLKP